jgi:hypothetical protein
MKGNNVLQFNTATMKDAMQHYLNTVLFKEGCAPKVSDVTICDKSRGIFEVSTESEASND